MKVYSLIVVLLVLTLAGCKKPITEPNSGIYRGTFYEIFDNGDTAGQGVANLALNDENLWFQLSGDTATGSPLSCHGNYTIMSSSLIKFEDISNVDFGYHPYNILDTSYQYVFDNKNFKMTLKVDTALYEYKLVRN